ncbi:MAG TPA: hypothetical protein VLV86_16195 [Vicinamibacterales bacterium]|nr:hypothetical protein [Vicinamibacterales bacterium]
MNIPAPTRCPHCDSHNIEVLPDREPERTLVTWYQCNDCTRMFSHPKPVTGAAK